MKKFANHLLLFLTFESQMLELFNEKRSNAKLVFLVLKTPCEILAESHYGAPYTK